MTLFERLAKVRTVSTLPRDKRRAKRDLKADLRRLGITQQEVADEAHVDRTFVCHVLAGRYKSKFVQAAIRRLLARAGAAVAE